MSYGYEDFAEIARKLGFRIDPPQANRWSGTHTIEGVLDGIWIRAHQWQGQYVHVELSAYFDPPADLRLTIQPAGVVSKLGHFLGAHDIEVGDPAFDSAFDVKGDEPERVKALLTPTVQRALIAWKKAGVPFRVTDEQISYWTTPGTYSSFNQAELENELRATAGLARVLSDALRSVPSSSILAPHVEAWRAYAGARGLAFSASPLRVAGTLDGASIVARATAVDDAAWGVDVRLRFAEPLPFLLRVRPKRIFDFLELSMAVHVEMNDEAFDRELRVTTAEPNAARAFLSGEVVAALLALHLEEGDVSLDSEGLAVRTKSMTDPALFGRIVDRVAIVTAKLHAHAGPYR